MWSSTPEPRPARRARRLGVALSLAGAAATMVAMPLRAQTPSPLQAQGDATRGVVAPPTVAEGGLYEALDELARGSPLRAEAALRALAEQGNVFAMERLGLMFWYGEALYPGVPRDRDIARAWFRRAARHGSPMNPVGGGREPADDTIVEWR